jgi:hypothetical protein
LTDATPPFDPTVARTVHRISTVVATTVETVDFLRADGRPPSDLLRLGRLEPFYLAAVEQLPRVLAYSDPDVTSLGGPVRVVGLDDVRVDIAMMRTPDGHGRLELTKFRTPTAISAEPANAPANTLGIRRIMFAVEGIEDVLARLYTHGAELVGEVEQYEDSYRLCYVRGPEGIIVALAEQLS